MVTGEWNENGRAGPPCNEILLSAVNALSSSDRCGRENHQSYDAYLSTVHISHPAL